MRKEYVVWFSTPVCFPVKVKAESKKEALILADCIVGDSCGAIAAEELNEMYNKGEYVENCKHIKTEEV